MAEQDAERMQAANGTTMAGWMGDRFRVHGVIILIGSPVADAGLLCTGPAGRAQSAKGVREKDTAGRGKGSGARSQNQKGRESSRGKGKGSWAF
jgi:hypothetical protein